MEKVLTLKEVTDLLQISYPTIYRWLRTGDFPTPINGRHRKLLWTEGQIEQWVNRQSTPSNIMPSNVSPVKQNREAKKFAQRQEEAKRALDRHRKAK